MTCIAAVTEEGIVYMTGDSAGVAGLSITTRADKKVFKKTDISGNEFGFGFTSSFRMGQLLQYSLVVPPLPQDVDLQAYMMTTFVSAIRQCLKEGGYSQISNNRETAGTFLVGVRGRIFTMENDYQIAECSLPFSACGCGENIALGSLHTTHHLGMMGQKLKPDLRLKMALHAAQEFSAGVRAPFHTITIT